MYFEYRVYVDFLEVFQAAQPRTNTWNEIEEKLNALPYVREASIGQAGCRFEISTETDNALIAGTRTEEIMTKATCIIEAYTTKKMSKR